MPKCSLLHFVATPRDCEVVWRSIRSGGLVVHVGGVELADQNAGVQHDMRASPRAAPRGLRPGGRRSVRHCADSALRCLGAHAAEHRRLGVPLAPTVVINWPRLNCGRRTGASSNAAASSSVSVTWWRGLVVGTWMVDHRMNKVVHLGRTGISLRTAAGVGGAHCDPTAEHATSATAGGAGSPNRTGATVTACSGEEQGLDRSRTFSSPRPPWRCCSTTESARSRPAPNHSVRSRDPTRMA